RVRAEGLLASLPETRAAWTAASEDLAHRRTEAEVAAERRRSLETARDRLAGGRRPRGARGGGAAARNPRPAGRGEGGGRGEGAEEREREEGEARERRSQNLRSRDEGKVDLDTASPSAVEAAARADRAEESTRARRSELDVAREGRFEAEVAETKTNSDLEHLIAQARGEVGALPAELPEPPDASPEALAALEAEAAELAASIDRMGPVNVLAYEEYEQESKRLTFLSTQRDDLVKSVNELQESIRKINATSS